MSGRPFRFRLERVRALRERGEQEAQQELARALAERNGAEAELQAAEVRLADAHAEQRTLAADDVERLGSEDLLARQLFAERVERQCEIQEQELDRRAAEVVERDAALTAAAIDREMLERLRERRRVEHERAMAGREREALDEIATARYRAEGGRP